MRTLSLIIKQQYFNEILRGSKNEETRIVRPSNYNRYILKDKVTGLTWLRPYDAIKLFVGYQPNRSNLLVSVDSAYLNFRTERVLAALANGVEVNIIYKLGSILESHL